MLETGVQYAIFTEEHTKAVEGGRDAVVPGRKLKRQAISYYVYAYTGRAGVP